MTRSPDRLYDLLPAVYRQRDAEQGRPLKALLQVIAEQVDVVEADIAQLYENWFIETSEDWVVPYLGDLVGYEAVHEAGQPNGTASEAERALARILIPRREVANTVRYRRRKGTLALLEELAHAVAGWPARAVEFYRLLAWTQALNHQHPARGRIVDLRDGDALDTLNGPFDALAHTVDTRRISSHRTRGRFNIPTVGVFVWRLGAYSVTRGSAYCREQNGPHCYTFSVLGNDAPLFTRPADEPSPHHIAGPLHVPAPIRRRALERNLDAYYGEAKSLVIWADGWQDHDAATPVPPESLVVADLSDWHYQTPRDHIAVDPVLGRLAFHPRQLPKRNVWVSYHYGFSDDLGGGEYRRPLRQPADATVYPVGRGAAYERLADALADWRDAAPRHAVIEIVDGGVYVEQVSVELPAGHTLQLRAANRTRPVLRLMDWHTARPDALWVRGDNGSRFTLDGVLVSGRGVQCEGPIAEINIRHCTLVPGWTVAPDCEPERPAEPSLELIDTPAVVTVERSILGSIQVSQDEVDADPIPIMIEDTILDATAPDRDAVSGPGGMGAHAVLTVARTTVFGEIRTHAIDRADDAIFTGFIQVARRQRGCMRFCSVVPGSRTPRRYRCQPDLAEQEARDALPTRAVGPPVQVSFDIGGTAPASGQAPTDDDANLLLALAVSNSTPDRGDPITFTLTIENRGPRAAGDIAVGITPPDDEDCLVDTVLRVTQGTFHEVSLLWEVGSLSPGEQAVLTAHSTVAEACSGRHQVATRILTYTFIDDGSPFITALLNRVRRQVEPQFTSIRYGHPGYAQLARSGPEEIARGAHDESEMGAFHDLFQPQRTANLEARLDEYVPAGAEAGIVFAT